MKPLQKNMLRLRTAARSALFVTRRNAGRLLSFALTGVLIANLYVCKLSAFTDYQTYALLKTALKLVPFLAHAAACSRCRQRPSGLKRTIYE